MPPPGHCHLPALVPPPRQGCVSLALLSPAKSRRQLWCAQEGKAIETRRDPPSQIVWLFPPDEPFGDQDRLCPWQGGGGKP